jgi:hypothetical protein
MAGMKYRTALAVTVGVWIAAVGSAVALAYELNRPLHSVDHVSQPAVPTLDATSALVVEPAQESIVYLPTLTIVGRARAAPVARRTTLPIDIPAMDCVEWRDLDIGSGRVQVCK